jgi:hypothetical protein
MLGGKIQRRFGTCDNYLEFIKLYWILAVVYECFHAQQQSWVLIAETIWFAKQELFAAWLFTEFAEPSLLKLNWRWSPEKAIFRPTTLTFLPTVL